MVARTPSTTSAYVIMRSEAEIEDRLVERGNVERLHCREQLLVRTGGEGSVQGPLETGEGPLETRVPAHVLGRPLLPPLPLGAAGRERPRPGRGARLG